MTAHAINTRTSPDLAAKINKALAEGTTVTINKYTVAPDSTVTATRGGALFFLALIDGEAPREKVAYRDSTAYIHILDLAV